MSFSTELAGLVTDQLSRFVTLNRHQLAGQVANLDFWLAQVRHALAALDGYGVRFVRMEAAQERYVEGSGTTVLVRQVDEWIERKPSPPRRIPDPRTAEGTAGADPRRLPVPRAVLQSRARLGG